MDQFKFDIKPELDPEYVCEQFGIDPTDFFAFLQGKKKLESDKTILFVIEEFKDYILNDKKKSPNTKTYYLAFLNQLQRFLRDGFTERNLINLDIEIFYEFLETCTPKKGDTIASGTIDTYQAIIKSMLEFAYVRKYVNEDLRGRFKNIGDELKPRYIPDGLVTSLLTESKKTSWPFLNYTIIYFMLMTGCRISELIKLRVGDFNLNENVIFIRKSKNGRERYVPMYPELKEAVLDFFSRTGLHEWDILNKEALFSKRCYDGRTPLSKRNVQYMLDKIYTTLGMKGLYTVHGLRHTFAVNCIKQGMPVDILQQVLGHKSIETTRIYIQLLPKDLKDEVTRKYPFPFEKLLKDMIGIGRIQQ